MMARRHDLNQILGAMDLFRTRMNNVFSEFDRSYTQPGWTFEETYPRTNLCDTGDNLELIAEIPGVAKDNLQVKIQGNYLEISGTRTSDIPEGFQVHRTERVATSFSRSFTLPCDVNAAQVEATLKDGILKMSLPKAETAKPRQITIN